MKLYKQKLKSLLVEGMKTPADLPNGMYIRVIKDPTEQDSSVEIWAPKPTNLRRYQGQSTLEIQVGWVGFGRKKLGSNNPCLGASEVFISNTVTQRLKDIGVDPDGWGPLMYDIALEVQGKKGLMPDRDEVSAAAGNLWAFYRNKRSDITRKLLDDRHSPKTDDTEDDCQYDTYSHHARNGESPEDHWATYVYYKEGTPIIDKLEKLGKIQYGEHPQSLQRKKEREQSVQQPPRERPNQYTHDMSDNTSRRRPRRTRRRPPTLAQLKARKK